MEKLIVEGGNSLYGSVNISGAKNSALPVIAASILTDQPLVIGNLPHLQDVTTILNLLGTMGADISVVDHMKVRVSCKNLVRLEAPYELVKTMRASILVLGPILSRYGKVKVALPGGCAIGSRPINMHVEGLRAMGAEVEIVGGNIQAQTTSRLHGADIVFDTITVTGTENLLMASVLADGKTTLKNAAREPEVVDLAKCLILMGAQISGAGTDTITIEGVETLNGCQYGILPDRIETGTFLTAVAMLGGKVNIKKAMPQTVSLIIDKLREVGANIIVGDSTIDIAMEKRPMAVNLHTSPYPGFPTDMQAQFVALNSVATGGTSTIVETVFENRFMHVHELLRMGANIEISGHTVIIRGVDRLQAAPVQATDLRASASLVLAAMNAIGTSVIDRIYHIDRGYECIEEKMQLLGAKIKRVPL